ncbi:MAG: PIN domain-containing protein [Alphaproteobacteria bacterium]|nr:PIN domain-containing protein [Alphaproteobacteria bacterium]
MFSPVVAVYDACILYPFHLRNIVVQAAVNGLVDARWTDAIHDEWMRNLLANAPDIPALRLEAMKRLMNDAVRDATVLGYERHIQVVNLPDADDRHVVAAAIQAGASVIVTWNLRDFPAFELGKFGLVGQSPDVFLANLYERAPEMLVESLAKARSNLRRTRVSAAEFIDILQYQRLTKLAEQMRKHLSDL